MSKIKRVVSLLLATVMVFSLAACGGDSNTETKQRGQQTTDGTETGSDSTSTPDDTKGEKPIEITVYSQLANFSGVQTGWSSKLLLDKFNVVITIIPDSDGVFDTRMEAGNLGDIAVFGSAGNDYIRAVEEGMLLDWNKYNLLDKYGTYIKDNMYWALQTNKELNGSILKMENVADGPLYGFGHNVATSSEDHDSFFYTWDIRWDLYKQLGYPVVKDLDDLLTLFKQMKEICPTDENGNPTYAVSPWPDWDGAMVMYVKALATAYYGYDELDLGLYDSDTGTFHDALEENGPYLTCLKFMNELYRNDLLDPNSMTQTYDRMSEKLKNGGVFFSIFNYAGSLAYNTEEHLAAGKYMYTMVPEEAVPLAYGMSVFGGNRIWTIGANTEYPDVCMELINYFCTPEGRLTLEYGPQGLVWDYNEDGYLYVTDFGMQCLTNEDTQMINEYAGGTWHDGALQINNTTWSLNAVNPDSKHGERYDWKTWTTTLDGEVTDIEKDWRDRTGCVDTQEYLNTLDYRVAPATTFTDSKRSDEFELVWTQVTKCIVDYTWKAIYAKTENEYNYLVKEMIKKAKSYGYQECLDWSLAEAARRHELEEEVRAGEK
ncbi:MAG: extracellular solute-binding protein [Lachnospiraceae bacterium]|nr:extracellular solute-binding protein [Lachnospiraceae bacterium]